MLEFVLQGFGERENSNQGFSPGARGARTATTIIDRVRIYWSEQRRSELSFIYVIAKNAILMKNRV